MLTSDRIAPEEPTPRAQPPRAEPEIIPPGDTSGSRIWLSAGAHHTARIQIVQLGPFSIALVVLLISVVVATAIVLVMGAALVGVVAASVVMVGAAVTGLLRRLFRE